MSQDEIAENDLPDSNEQEGETLEPEQAKPALVIQIYSWATLLVGGIMLVLGLLAGYFGRPLLASQPPTPTAVTPPIAALLPTTAAAEPVNAQTQEAGAIALMEAVLSQTRHFTGDEAASVTLIEFSDFQ